VFVVLLVAGIAEARSSRLQSWIFTRAARGLDFHLGRGASDSIVFPVAGPYDVRLGYTRVPALRSRLDTLGFDLTDQARFSGALLEATRMGAYPVYRAKTSAGLVVLDRQGSRVLREAYPAHAYTSFDSIPRLLWQTLLFVESRDFLDPEQPRRNPAVEWDRLARSVAELGLRVFGMDRNVPGGSTLATQIEKFRHSPDGVTRTPADKLHQMLTASLRAYRRGPNTLAERRRIVADYLNSVPLAAQAGHGEVIGTADGLWAWYGVDLATVNEVLRNDPTDSAGRALKGRTYREVLSLLLAHRRPSYYLARRDGRADLGDLTDAYLGLLVADHVVPRWLADEARAARPSVRPLDRAPQRAPPPFVTRKAQNLVRSQLLSLTGVPGLYELDRLDLVAHSDLDMQWHEATTRVLRSLSDPSFLAANGLAEPRLLQVGDPTKVLYSVTLMERTADGNVIRVQTDNYEGPLSLSAASRLELGSTAKLRTLVTYLEIVEELHASLFQLPPDSLNAMPVAPSDRLTRWAADYLLARPGATVPEMLSAALDRRYSASTSERFVTGGGVQAFANFDAANNGQVLSIREAFRQSVNLPFVRLMRDLVGYEMARAGTASVLENQADPLRLEYLTRFADQEGATFVRSFFRKYEGKTGPDVFDALVQERHLGSTRLAWAFRTIAPDADETLFAEFIRENAPNDRLSDAAMTALYARTDPTAQTLADLGHLARIHPLELWVARWALHHPGTTLQDVLVESRDARIEVYGWLFRTRSRNAQDERIRTMLEIEAFQGILRRWRRVGYPFANIVPSLGTAIGSSGDRPLALAELAGIVLNGGLRYPVVRVHALRFAQGTPYETHFTKRRAAPERVLSEEVAAAVRGAMIDVVENGTARRARGALVASGGTRLTMGGKTGTGDNRYRVFSRSGALVESRVVNRTSTLVFFAGDRYFGVVVAYVPGESAGSYNFTSALPAQVLKVLGPRLEGFVAPGASAPAGVGRAGVGSRWPGQR
jgi:membrane peptidoglycan carboxypeptidase